MEGRAQLVPSILCSPAAPDGRHTTGLHPGMIAVISSHRERPCCPPHRAGPPVPRVLEEGISEAAAKELVDKALVYLNPALGVGREGGGSATGCEKCMGVGVGMGPGGKLINKALPLVISGSVS